MYDTTQPLAQRVRHLVVCCEHTDCAGQTCDAGTLLATNPNAVQDPTQLNIVTWPISDQEMLDANAAETAAVAAAQAEADAAAAKATLKQSAIAKLVAGQPLTPDEAALLVIA